jgi:hypothetical protein
VKGARWVFVGACAVGGCGDAHVVAPPPHPVATASASASASATPPDYVYPPDDPIPQLRTGALAPNDYADAIVSRVIERHVGDVETLLIEVPLTDEQAGALDKNDDRRTVVSLTARASAPETPYAFAVRGADFDPPNAMALYVWARRPAASAGKAIAGDVYTPVGNFTWTSSGRVRALAMHLRFKADDTKAATDAKALSDFYEALATHLSEPEWSSWHRGPWNAYAAARLRSLVPKKKPTGPAPGHVYAPYVTTTTPGSHGDLARLMETTTGVTAIQEALQNDRALFLANARAKQTTAVSTLKAPALSPHPWSTMLTRLKQPLPREELADFAPAEFHFARASSITSLLRAIDQAVEWGGPLATVIGSINEDRHVFARYEAELGLRRGPLTDALGPKAIAEIAIVGSDPYFIEGTDVTLVLKCKSRDLVTAALAGALASHEKDHGAFTTTKRTHDGVDVSVARSADGVVRQQRASIGDYEIVSNSANAIDRVLDAKNGKRARLANELDFQYMLGRDAGARADVLVFASDKFVSEVIGPKQKIQEARRQIALAELASPGFSALLYAHLYGKSAASVADLTRTKLLDAADLTHGTGGAITWKPGTAATSAWGSIASLTPILDLSPVDKVTDAEKAAYTRFADSYQQAWKHYVDPFAVRIATDSSRLAIDVRELPLIDNSDYKDLLDFVGDTRIAPGDPQGGMRAVFGIGQDSAMRQEIDRDTRSLFRKHDFSFDWIGDWAQIGLLDRTSLATTTLAAFDEELPQVPRKETRRNGRFDEMLGMTKLPLYGAIAVRNPMAAAIALAAVRAYAEDTLPGMIEWGEAGQHRGVSLVRIGLNAKEGGSMAEALDGVQVFYAIASGALVVATNEIVLRKVIDERLDGRGAKGLGDNPSGTQLAFDVGGDAGGAVMTTMTWLLEMATLDDGTHNGRATAEALLRGAPESANDAARMAQLAVAYFGAIPSPPDGGAYTLAADGVKDPVRGTLHAPAWPALPIDGSPVARIVKALRQVRTEIGFDEEPGSTQAHPLKSMHAKATFELR